MKYNFNHKYTRDYEININGTLIQIEKSGADHYKRFLERCGLYYDKGYDWEKWQECDIMHGSQKIAGIRRNGTCEIYVPEMMPYNLYLETEVDDDFDQRVQNVENFYYWCSTRMLPSNRTYSKAIWNSLRIPQVETDKDRALLALSYFCLSLTDIYWVKRPDQTFRIDFSKINLYENFKNSAYMNVTLKGILFPLDTVMALKDNLATGGCLPKAWVQKEDGLYLIKGGTEKEVKNELLASKICRCFDVNQVLYEECDYDGQLMTASKNMTSLAYSIVPMEYYEIYLMNHGRKKMDAVLELDAYSYYMMNILDYLTGNTDRHWGNWGVLVDNMTNKPLRLHDLMDFNQTFEAYDTLDGAPCLTTDKKQTQKDAAIEAVKKIGLNQIAEVREEWFEANNIKEMFFARLAVLQEM